MAGFSRFLRDGDIVYRSLSVLLHNQDNHSYIRQEILNFLSDHEDRYTYLIYYNGEGAYKKCMRQHRQNGEEAVVIFQAAADLYGLHIYISNYNNYGVSQIVRARADQSARGWLHLRWTQDHYVLIADSSQDGAIEPVGASNLTTIPLRRTRDNQLWTELPITTCRRVVLENESTE